MKTVEKVLIALFVVLLLLNTVIYFCEGNVPAVIAWVNVWVWFAIALHNRKQADYYMESCENLRDIASDLVHRLREILERNDGGTE
jgi:hypothetical protein